MKQPESEYDIATRLDKLAENLAEDAVLLRVAAEGLRRLAPEPPAGRSSDPTEPGSLPPKSSKFEVLRHQD